MQSVCLKKHENSFFTGIASRFFKRLLENFSSGFSSTPRPSITADKTQGLLVTLQGGSIFRWNFCISAPFFSPKITKSSLVSRFHRRRSKVSLGKMNTFVSFLFLFSFNHQRNPPLYTHTHTLMLLLLPWRLNLQPRPQRLCSAERFELQQNTRIQMFVVAALSCADTGQLNSIHRV